MSNPGPVTAGKPPILQARGLLFRHPGAAAPLFRDLSIAIAPGEFAGVIGPNGAGKTTLLMLLGGIVAPQRGEASLGGRPVRSIPPRERARRVAVVFQESRILFDFTVLEIALMRRAPYLRPLGLERPEDFAAARAALRQMDLLDREGTPLRELSSGERQRALIARALAQEPSVVLMDEPTAFLDLRHRLQIYEILARLNRDDGLTVVASSHDLNMAARYSSRLLLFDRGRLAADGAPAAVLTPDLIRRVYATEARIERDPSTGALFVVPLAPL